MSERVVQSVVELGFPWTTFDPFLFCVHHDDAYPRGTEAMGPDPELLRGRNIGMDFTGIDGWRMYHGDVVPGFPRHPHRGFETVTLARRGYIDHSDSLGATARFGHGDAQWMTAGAGIVHSEMFPLVHRDADNPVELFQIWLNLPRRSKMARPYFSMLWRERIPRLRLGEGGSNGVELTLVAGSMNGPMGDERAPTPPPDSWAASPEAEVAIWTMKLAPGAAWTIPPASEGVLRTLYFFAGATLDVGDQTVQAPLGVRVRGDRPTPLRNGELESEVLMLQGRPIGEPVVQHGPFVMNSPAEINQAIMDYRRTEFGGWPWGSDGPVHPREDERFAVHVDGRRERPSE
ncbi:pirin family protein [Paraliomyxa miuraensis]|uniref:pirin family protein n=1 Tax=Paraliomyxa miuraensis TaxID=376150 RepID=UPI00225BDB1C|nr:pirin family protein [Paraliomyxa miuraensis]MCX4241138.1 pirin family protein [Paraliomyxa miuraensis]